MSNPVADTREGLPESYLNIARFCAIECALQRSGETSVSDMLNAWSYALKCPRQTPTVAVMTTIGRFVEPGVNHGLRRVNVRVGSDLPPAWHDVPTLIGDLARGHRSPEAFFLEFERIHPFEDGNGRTGAILYNLIKGTLMDPEWPPNYFNDPRRRPGYGEE